MCSTDIALSPDMCKEHWLYAESKMIHPLKILMACFDKLNIYLAIFFLPLKNSTKHTINLIKKHRLSIFLVKALLSEPGYSSALKNSILCSNGCNSADNFTSPWSLGQHWKHIECNVTEGDVNQLYNAIIDCSSLPTLNESTDRITFLAEGNSIVLVHSEQQRIDSQETTRHASKPLFNSSCKNLNLEIFATPKIDITRSKKWLNSKEANK